MQNTENNKVMDEVLTELGWNTGVHLPVATMENQQLQIELERLIHARSTANAQLNQLRNKRQELDDHSKHLSQEQVEIASLLTTQRGNQSAENDQIRILKLEGDKLSRNVRDFQKQENVVDTREQSLKNNLCHLFKRLEELKKQVSYDTDAIRLWEDSLLKNEEDNEMIKKFSLQDQNRAKELELRRQKLHKEIAVRKRTLGQTIIEIKGLEVALEKSHCMYLEAKKDRTNLLNQWRESVSHLRQRHKDMHLIHLEMERLRESIAKKIEDTEEQKTFYLNQLNNNRETEKQTQDLAKAAAKAREDLRNLIKKVRDYQNELNIGKYELASLCNSLEQARTKSKHIERDMNQKNAQLQQVNTTNKHLNTKLTKLKNKKMTSNERARELEKMVENNESIVTTLTTEIERLQKLVYRSTQALKKMQEIDDSHKIEIRGLKTGIDVLEKHEKTLEKEVQSAREIVYDFDYNILNIESKIENIEGSVRENFRQDLQEKIRELTNVLTEKSNIKQMLLKQISLIQDDIRRLGALCTNDNIELAKLQDTLQKELRMVEGGKRQVKAGQIRSQEKQVEENILRLRVMQAQKNLDNIDNSLYTLERQRIEMETAMKERQVEIGVEKDVLELRKRNLLGDKSTIRSEIQERLLRNEQYKKKFEYQVSLLGVDDDGRPLSPTYFKLKTTQERVLLQQEGDEWDLKVKQAEQEIVAMENTLKLVNISNEKFKTSLCTVEETGPEEEEFKKIEQEHYCLLKKLRAAQKKKNDCVKAIETLNAKFNQVNESLDSLNVKKSTLENSIRASEKDIANQNDRLTRANRTLTKVSLKVRSSLPNTTYEQELKVRNLNTRNQSVLQQLLELSIKNIETSPVIANLCQHYQIPLPRAEKYKPVPRHLSDISTIESLQREPSQSPSETPASSIYSAGENRDLVSTTNILFVPADYEVPPSPSTKSTKSSKRL